MSANHIFEEWYKRTHDQIKRDVPAHGKPFRRAVPITFPEPEACFSVDTETGPRPVAAVRLDVEITRSKRLVPASRVTRYSGEGGPLGESVEFDLDSELGTVSLHKMNQGPIHVRYRPDEP